MPGPSHLPRPHGPADALVTQVVDELARRLAEDPGDCGTGPLPWAEWPDGGDARGHALVRLRVLARVKQAVRSLEDQAAHAAAVSGAGYPEIGEAVGISRQGARRRWPGLITTGAHPAPARPTPRSS
ncbi:hypothetical protein KUM39_18395 [Streptomyces sp. J2-1]|uniref:hypothetical protein n=1 Tax=Streptomyces corallincola TaxID=2851888 RepID=UPI001C37F8E2|nr:hypothetical protein [Streptomyces corallincola]MBV2356325.1 hypothetical protein [Streptomyces corallincola]